MLIKIGYDISIRLEAPTAILYTLRIHPTRESDLLAPENLRVDPWMPSEDFLDVFGNRVTRLSAPAGLIRFRNEAVVRDSGIPDEWVPDAVQQDVRDLPLDTLPYILPSRYCEADSELLDFAWSMFGGIYGGWNKVQAICNFVHFHLQFDYKRARNTRTEVEAFRERTGVCRDFSHLAITLCRCLNIPAMYAAGYLGDIGIPPNPSPMDFSAWFEVYLNGRWYTFDARHNKRRIGRIVMARGRDAVDGALTTVFGKHSLESFYVHTTEMLG